jgi:hypothetical protein
VRGPAPARGGDAPGAGTLDPGAAIREDRAVDALHEGQKVWVEQADGSQRAGIFVGEADQATWFGGGPGAYVVYPDTRSGEEVSIMQVIPREEG